MSSSCVPDWGVFWCYVAAAATCLVLSAVYLLGRFKSGNNISSILFGWPQLFFYTINIGAGCLALMSAQAYGHPDALSKASSNYLAALLDSCLLAVAAVIGLRTTINTSVSASPGKKIEAGPGQLFAILLDNVEQRIDHARTALANEEIRKLALQISPRAVVNFVLPLCFNHSEKNSEDREKVTAALEAIVANKALDISENERSALMLSHLHKIFGFPVLESTFKLTDKAGASNAPAKDVPETLHTEDATKTDGGGVTTDALKLQGVELSMLHEQLLSSNIIGGQNVK